MAVAPEDGHEPRSNADTPPTFTDWRGGEATNRDDDHVGEEDLRNLTMTAANWTNFDPREGRLPSESVTIKGKNLWERLDSHNRDCWWRYRDDVDISASMNREYKHGLLWSLIGQAEMTPTQGEQAFEQLMELDLGRLGLPTPLIAFVLCALVWNEDARQDDSKREYHPQRNPENNDPYFQRLEERLIVSQRRIHKSSLTSVYNKLMQGEPKRRHPSTWKPYFRHRNLIPQNPSGPHAEWQLEDIQNEDG